MFPKQVCNDFTIEHDNKLLTTNPDPEPFRFLEPEHLLECILEGEIESLSWKISQDVGSVSSPD